MAIYELTLLGKCYGQQTVNRFHYATSTTGNNGFSADDVQDAFESYILPKIRDILTNAQTVEFNWLVTRNLYDVDDFAEKNLGSEYGSQNDGQSLPPFVSLAIRTTRMATGWRRGYKRFAGVGEASVVGSAISASLLSVVNILCAALDDSMGIPAVTPVDAADLVVLRFRKVIDPESGKEKYVPQENETIQRTYMRKPAVWEYHRLTTQRSRIAGQGQ